MRVFVNFSDGVKVVDGGEKRKRWETIRRHKLSAWRSFLGKGWAWTLYFSGLQNHHRWWLQPWNYKTLTPWKESYDQPRSLGTSPHPYHGQNPPAIKSPVDALWPKCFFQTVGSSTASAVSRARGIVNRASQLLDLTSHLPSCAELSIHCPRVSPVAPWEAAMWRKEYWSGLPFPSPGDVPDPGIEPGSPALQADSLPTELLGKPHIN